MKNVFYFKLIFLFAFFSFAKLHIDNDLIRSENNNNELTILTEDEHESNANKSHRWLPWEDPQSDDTNYLQTNINKTESVEDFNLITSNFFKEMNHGNMFMLINILSFMLFLSFLLVIIQFFLNFKKTEVSKIENEELFDYFLFEDKTNI